MNRREAIKEMGKGVGSLGVAMLSGQGLAGTGDCPLCKGTGRDLDDPNCNCPDCDGTGNG